MRPPGFSDDSTQRNMSYKIDDMHRQQEMIFIHAHIHFTRCMIIPYHTIIRNMIPGMIPWDRGYVVRTRYKILIDYCTYPVPDTCTWSEFKRNDEYHSYTVIIYIYDSSMIHIKKKGCCYCY